MIRIKRNLIVGIDPGTKAGVAVLSLRGKVLGLESKKNFGFDSMVEFILKHGSPLIIATDRKKVPSRIEKLAAAFDAKIFSPEKDMTGVEKQELTKKFEVKDDHQKDALASALAAFKVNRKQLKQIERTLENLSLNRYFEDVCEMVMKGKAHNIAEAIEKLMEKERKPVKKKKDEGLKEVVKEREKQDLLRDIKEKEKSIKALKEYISVSYTHLTLPTKA